MGDHALTRPVRANDARTAIQTSKEFGVPLARVQALALATVTETHPVLMSLFKIGAAITAWQFMSGFLAYLRSLKA